MSNQPKSYTELLRNRKNSRKIRAEKISDIENRRQITPVKYDKYCNDGWIFEPFPFGGGIMDIVNDRIIKLLNRNKVFCGSMATSIRGYRVSYIIYKKLKN